MAIHLRAGASIADMVRFKSGVDGTSSVATLPYPLETGAPETVLCKRKSPWAETVTMATTSKETTTSTGQPAQGEEEQPAKKQKGSANGSGRTDVILMPFECHCGSVFNNNREFCRHITVAHKNEYWNCSGEWIWDDGSETPCPTICADHFTLWKHFRSLHQDRYLYYCDVAGCKYGNDKQTQIPKHKLQEHAKKSSDTETLKVLKCSVCLKVFGQCSKLTQHAQICGKPRTLPFQCEKCPKNFHERDQLHIHTKQVHPAVIGDRSGFFKCPHCPKDYTSISACHRHIENMH